MDFEVRCRRCFFTPKTHVGINIRRGVLVRLRTVASRESAVRRFTTTRCLPDSRNPTSGCEARTESRTTGRLATPIWSLHTKVEYELGVSGPDGDDANPFDPPRSRPYPTPAHEFNLASRIIKRGADKLGLHLVREPLAIPTRDWNGRPACINAGTCRLGCRISAKSSIDVTYVPRAEKTGKVQIRAGCMARKITTGLTAERAA